MTKRKGIAKKIVAGALALAVAAGGVSLLGYTSRDNDGNWFGNLWSDNGLNVGNDNGGIISDIKENGIRVLSVMELANDDDAIEKVFQITATVSPENTESSLIGSLEWGKYSPPGMTWSEDKAVTDYATLTQESPGIFKLSILQGFSDKINVKISLEKYPVLSATCVVDYVKRLTAVELSLSDSYNGESASEINCGQRLYVKTKTTYTEGTIQGTFSRTGVAVTTLSDVMFNTLVNNVKKVMPVTESDFNKSSTAFLNFLFAPDGSGDCTVRQINDGDFLNHTIETDANYKRLRILVEEFKNYLTEHPDENCLTLSIPYSYTYGDMINDTITATVDFKINPDSIVTLPERINLDNTNIIA